MPYSIPGVPDGDYRIYILVDMNADGLMGRGDVQPGEEGAGQAHVAGSNATANVSVQAIDVLTMLATDHTRHVNGE